MPTRESEQRRRLSPPAARAAPPASPRPFPQPDPSPQSPSSLTSLCRFLACKVAAPSVVPGQVIGQKRIDQNVGRTRLDAKCGMAEPCRFHRNHLLGNVYLYCQCQLSSRHRTCTFDSVAPDRAYHCLPLLLELFEPYAPPCFERIARTVPWPGATASLSDSASVSG